jgi:hypothetical protein
MGNKASRKNRESPDGKQDFIPKEEALPSSPVQIDTDDEFDLYNEVSLSADTLDPGKLICVI